MSPHFRRGGSLLVAAALTVSTLTGSSIGASAAEAPSYDDRPAAAAAGWLTAQLTDGVVHNDQYDFDDIGLSADVAFGLLGLGGRPDTVTQVVDAIEPRAKAEWYTSTFDGVTTVYSGSLAKALVLAQATGRDGHSFGGADLVTDLEGHVAVAAPITGRLEHENDGFGDANVVGQAYAAQGLAAAGSPRATDVLAFLLDQQCSDGSFRLYFTPDKAAADQSCDGGTASGESSADTDATAAAVLALQEQADNPLVAAALDDAKAWLQSQQMHNGAFGGGTATEAANTNSTGLAGWALGALGDTERASRAAVWVRQHQVVNAGACTLFDTADLGATAYDDEGLATARKDGITDADADRFRRATSQALPVLQWAPVDRLDDLHGDPVFRRYWKARHDVHISRSGLIPGEGLCAVRGARQYQGVARTNGQGGVAVHLPRGTGVRRFDVSSDQGDLGQATFSALDRLDIKVELKKRSVAKGGRQVVRAQGLARHEQVQVRLRHKRIALTKANREGILKLRFRVEGKVGRAKVRVLGQFPGIRHGAKTFRVTR